MHVHTPEAILHSTPILSLRPTQMAVGMHEVERKRKAWADRELEKISQSLATHMVPVVLGPDKAPFLIDHHHLALALHRAGVDQVFVTVVADLHRLDAGTFWTYMDFRGWTHPYDEKGKRRDYSDLPADVRSLKDDPYRALAGELRATGGFAKDSTPFAEFLWADFLRRRIKPKDAKKHFEEALVEAQELAKDRDAAYLPGWCGIHVPTKARSDRTKLGKKDRSADGTAEVFSAA